MNPEVVNALPTTPVRRLAWIEHEVGAQVWAKLEQVMPSGSFKYRGALNRLSATPVDVPIITASAGNHALAIAEAARRTGHRVTVCLPHNATEVKRHRLSAYDISILEVGDSLDDAAEHGRQLAAARHGEFVSPYNDDLVIDGQATMAREMLQQVPDLDLLLVPVGGGGLLSGCVRAAGEAGADLRLVGCQPHRFHPFERAVTTGQQSREPLVSLFADGLLLNPESGAVTLDIVRQSGAEMVLVEESDIAAGMHALIHHESMLIEGAGAIGLGALLGQVVDLGDARTVGVILSGGNVSLTTLAAALTQPHRSERVRQCLGIQGHTTEAAATLVGPARNDLEAEDAIDRPEGSRLLSLTASVDRFHREAREFTQYLGDESLERPEGELATIERLGSELDALLSQYEMIEATPDPDLSAATAKTHQLERLERLITSIGSFMLEPARWQSPSYDQAVVASFSSLADNGNPGVNYSRYGSRIVTEREASVAEMLGFDLSRVACHLVSSGMAAYGLIESYLIRHVLEADDCVLLPPYIYFETAEQIESLRHLTMEQVRDHGVDALLDGVRLHQPKVVFVDPMTNTADLRVTDIRSFLDGLPSAIEKDVWVVIDGTMLSGAFDPFDWVDPDGHVHLLYYESGSKYLQMGLDLTLVGVVAAPVELRSTLDRLRRNTGQILTTDKARLIPVRRRDEYLTRMDRFSENAEVFSTILGNDPRLVSRTRPVHPVLASHPDHAIASAYRHLGGLMTFEFSVEEIQQRHLLDALIERVVQTCSAAGLPMTKGVSFGFTSPRISAASAMAESMPPFLRLSVGTQHPTVTADLARILADCLAEFLASLLVSHL